MTQIDYQRYEGYDLATKYGWMQTGAGAEAAAGARRLLGDAANAYAGSDQALKTALRGLSVDWTGSAATATAGALNRAAQWVAGAGQAGGTASGQVDRYSGSFAELKPKIAPPYEMNGLQSFAVDYAMAPVRVFDAQADSAHLVAAKNRQLDDDANRALYAHEETSRGAVGGFPQVTAMAPLTSGGGAASGLGAPGSAQPDPAVGITAAAAPTGGAAGPTVPTGSPVVTPGSAPAASPSGGIGVLTPVPVVGGVGAPRPGGPVARSGGGLPPAGRGVPEGGAPRAGGGIGAGSGSAAGGAAAAPPTTRATGGSGYLPPPWTGGGASRAQDREHRRRYTLSSAEAFLPQLPAHVPPVLGED